MRVVIALGGNALLKRGETPDAEHLTQNIKQAADAIAEIAREHTVIVTHGNGPQIGLLSLQNEAYTAVPPYPLDVLGAESDGMIGYLVERELRSKLPNQEVATLLTQVTVAPDDPAFATPTKPIGPVFDESTAQRLANERGWRIAPDGAGFRRVTPSPAPKSIVEIKSIRTLVDAGVLVICLGGGGIPVRENPELLGVEAVVDKDWSAALLARMLSADVLLLLTDIDGVYLNWGGAAPSRLKKSTPQQLAEIQFDPGSMGPKVAAACDFVKNTNGAAAIGSLSDARRVLAGDAGTFITHVAPRSPIKI